MELFKFVMGTSNDPTVLEKGELINNIQSVMWVERYRDPGEFQIVGLLSSGLREFLPMGTFISHADTMEVMIVENHEIEEGKDDDPVITITGRTLESYLENRIVGLGQARASSTYADYNLAAGLTWAQAVTLINDHIASATYPNDALGNVSAVTTASGTGTNVARVIPRGDVLSKLQELLAIDDLGIKNIRRNTFGVVGSPTTTQMVVYQGVNRSATVIFSWKAGDLEGADYLWSDKVKKNSAYVLGRYVQTVVDQGPTKYDRRIMLVDGSDLDGSLTAPPTGTALTTIITKMTERGNLALKSQYRLTLTRADISKVTRYQYRRDFNVGDLISLDGNFGQIAVMRVIEYVEIEDENGESGHPTFSLPGV